MYLKAMGMRESEVQSACSHISINRMLPMVLSQLEDTMPSLNPGGRQASDVVLLNHWSIRNYDVQRGDIVSLVSPRNPEQKIIKRVIALEGDIIKTIGYKKKYVKVPHGHIWVEGDHHGHSFDSNAFGPVSLGLLHARATHILWPPQRWQKLQPMLPPERKPLQREQE
ncbi:mitochondrial inner membrane protease subunit 2 isoform 4-T4 [Alca torda]